MRYFYVALISFLFLTHPLFSLADTNTPSSPFSLSGPKLVRQDFYSDYGSSYHYEENSRKQEKYFYGEFWRLSYEWTDKKKGKELLLETLRDRKAKVLLNDEDKVLAIVDEDKNHELWVNCSLYSSECGFTVHRLTTLSVSDEIKLVYNKDYLTTSHFYFEHDGKDFIALEVNIGNGDVTCQCRYRNSLGQLSRNIHWSRRLELYHGPFHVCADIPQVKGQMHFTIHPDFDRGQKEVVVRLVKQAPMRLNGTGMELGGLQVRSVPTEQVEVLPEFGDSHSNPSFSRHSLIADKQPNGDALFWLPPGLWTLRLKDKECPFLRYVDTHFVAVEAGHITILDVPKSLGPVFSPSVNGRLELREPQLLSGGLGQVQLSLLEVEDKSIVPSRENLSIYEGVQKGSVQKVTLVTHPLELVLLLDSSGSMKGSMVQALDATKQFIEMIPSSANLTVVDFDTTPKVLPNKTRAESLAALKKVRANGATALYDSILLGLKLLSQKKRPALVVFTDGVDANWNDTKPGSKATKSQVFTKVKSSNVPIFTIGYGKKPDVDTLSRVATLTGGAYYSAKDKSSLDKVFGSIKENLGRQYLVDYKRPMKAVNSDVPVLSIVVDNSGSMDHTPETEGCDYRIEKVRQILNGFVRKLPDGQLMQLLTFSSDTRGAQMLTDNKSEMLRAISMMKGDGGTKIIHAVEAAYKTLKDIPSSRKMLVFLADAALKVKEEEQSHFDILLGKIKDANINSLWLGIVDKDEGGAYGHAAVKSGGNKVIGTDLKKLSDLFDRLSKKTTVAKADNGVSLRMTLTHRAASGKNTRLSGSISADFPLIRDESRVISPESVRWEIGPSLKVYDPKLSKYISGNDLLAKEVRVSKRIPMEISGKNEAVQVKVHEAVFLSRLRGVEPPTRKRFLAITTSMDNVMKEQKVAVFEDGSSHPAAWMSSGAEPKKYVNKRPTYLIPDVARHVFLRWNNEISCPTSEATWLAETPLVLPRKQALSLAPDAPVSGTLIFIVPNEQMKQMSLHLFDTEYDHIDLPLVGVMDTKKEAYGKLPQKAQGKLSSTFDFSINAFEDVPSINGTEAGNDRTFRVVEGELQSKVQAHLELSPKERISFALSTHLGELILPVSNLTEQVPLGFYRSSMFTPGSRNVVRLAFLLPTVLAKGANKGTLLVDLFGGTQSLPLGKQGETKYALKEPSAKGKGLSIYVHKSGFSGRNVYLEVSITDDKDDNHTSLKNLFRLQGMQSAVSPSNTDLLFGLTEDDFVMDGRTRRGVLTFTIPYGVSLDGWKLQSSIFHDLNIPLSKDDKYTNKVLLLKKLKEENLSRSYEQSFMEALQKLTIRRKSTAYKKPGEISAPIARLGDAESPKNNIPVPQFASIGARPLFKLSTHDELLAMLRGLRCVVGHRSIRYGRYAPEAVLAQGWGTIPDLTALAKSSLNRLGIQNKCISIPLSQKGKAKYREYRNLPGLLYVLDGQEWLLVIPEMKDRNEISELLDYKHVQDELNLQSDDANIQVFLHLERKEGAKNAQAADAASALSGGDGNQGICRKCLLRVDAEMTDLSLGSIDIGFTETKKDGRPQLRAVFEGQKGRQFSRDDDAIFMDEWRVVGEEIIVRASGQDELRRYWPLAKDDEMTARFHTLGLNLPELDDSGIKVLQELRDKGHSEAKNPDSLSALRWYTRGLITRFIGAQTAYERELAKELSIETGRVKQFRAICVTVSRQDGKEVDSEIDLMNVLNDIHSGDDKARRAFNILSGMMAARLEAKILEKSIGAFEIWRRAELESASDFVTTNRGYRDDFIRELKKLEFPEHVIKALEKSRKTIVFPKRPAIIEGEPRWAWLEVDPETFTVQSVLDNEARGAILDDLIGNLLADELQYVIGRMKGVEAAVWSVSAFSLKLDDYKEIKKKAHEFLKGLAKGFSYDGPGTSTSTKPGSDNNVKVSLGVGSSSVAEAGPVKFNLFGNPVSVKPHDSVAGFNNGFKDGVEYYFKQMAK